MLLLLDPTCDLWPILGLLALARWILCRTESPATWHGYVLLRPKPALPAEADTPRVVLPIAAKRRRNYWEPEPA